MMRRLWSVSIPLLYLFGGTTMLAQEQSAPVPTELRSTFQPPAAYQHDLGTYRSPLLFDNGLLVKTPQDWRKRRQEILAYWHAQLGTWPALLERPHFERREAAERSGYHEIPVSLDVAKERRTDGYLLVPEGTGPFPAMLVVYYEPETAIGNKQPLRDFGVQLVTRGFAILSIGIDPRPIIPEAAEQGLQPLSYLALWAANALTALAAQPEVDPARIGVLGHSYGGKWALFAAAFDERFACGVWSDPGIVFDETRPNVNYWEPWYLGWEPDRTHKPGLPTADNPRTGPYRHLIEQKRDLHELLALLAPRPFLVSGGAEDPPERWRALNHVIAVNRLLGVEHRVAMTNREGHPPTEESNRQIALFLEFVLQPGRYKQMPQALP
jgi:hypothetical protein